jgi:hypothetical protein
LSSKFPIGYIEVRVFSHATEDDEKVISTVRKVLPEELSVAAVFQKSSLTGHHGNPIIILETKLTDKQALPLVLARIGKNLSSLDKETLEQEIKLHLEKRDLYLRFDKQAAACSGELKLASVDPIHLKIHFKNKTADEIIDLSRESGLLP